MEAIALDATPVAKLRPGGEALALAEARREEGAPFAATATTLMEVRYGLEKRARDPAWRGQLAWLEGQLAAGLLEVLPFTGRAAAVAAALRAAQQAPPTADDRARRGSKAEARVAWIADLQTAATAYVHGYALASDDQHHTAIARLLREIVPGAPALEVLPAPF